MSAAAKGLYEKLQQMRLELFIIALQHLGQMRLLYCTCTHFASWSRIDESLLWHSVQRQATEVECEMAIIPDAELIITRSRQDKYRLIVASRNRCITVLAQDCEDILLGTA